MGACPIILFAPMLMLLPPFGTLDILWARKEIAFFIEPPDPFARFIGDSLVNQMLP